MTEQDITNDRPNYNYVWFIDGKHSVSDIVIDKVKTLVSNNASRVSVLYDKRIKHQERSFWLSDKKISELDDLIAQEEQLHSDRKMQLERAFVRLGVTINFSFIEGKNYHQVIKDLRDEDAENILIVQNQEPDVRHPIFQLFASLPMNILLLKNNRWHKSVSVLGSIDPLHEHARPETLDHNIAQHALWLAEKLEGNWMLGHACFVPPAFLNYRKQFEDIHKDGMQRFSNLIGITKDKCLLLNGLPEHALRAWVKNKDGDILVLGIVTRNRLMSHLIGSTTLALLHQPPADMYLIHEDH